MNKKASASSISDLYSEVLLTIDTLTPVQLEKKLNKLYLLHLAKTLKNKFPEDNRTVEEFAKIIKEELFTNGKKYSK